MASIEPRNKIIPLEIASIIIDQHDCGIEILDDKEQIYGKSLEAKEGTVKYKNGNCYKGELTLGMLQGQGVFYWTDGVKYEGTFQHNQITGNGRYEWPDGSYYEGEVKVGLRHGRGIHVTAKEQCIYEGEWKDGLKHGKGVMKNKNGPTYEGSFEKGLKHGFGRIMYPSGNYYEGNWVHDKKEGHGTMYWNTVNEKYTGNWVNNKQEGWGTHIWLEGKGDGKFLRNRYEGEWRNGVRHGVGVFYYSNGSKYEGEWVDNLKEGFAIFTYEDGRVFKGFYKNDKMIPNSQKDSVLGDLDLNTQEKNQLGSMGDDKLVKKQNSMVDANNSSRKFNKKQTTLTSPDKEEPERQNEIENNPYEAMLDISDLFADDAESELSNEMKEVKNLLLRYHNELKLWYRLYVSKQQQNFEESFALNFKMFWKMLRDSKILSPKATIAGLNRLFLQGKNNSYSLHTTQETLQKKLYLAKKEFHEDTSHSEREDLDLEDEQIPPEELLIDHNKIDMHDENRFLFFRHFVDALVRIAYLKHGGIPNFAKKIEKILQKIHASIENKKKSKLQIEEETALMKARTLAEPLKDRFKSLFYKFPAKNQTFLYETIDHTMTVQDILLMFEACGIITNEDEKEMAIHAAERAYDPEECYVVPTVVLDANKEKQHILKGSAERMDKLGDLVTSEVIFLEFFDIVLLTLLRKEGVLKDEEAKKKLAEALKAMETYAKDREEDLKDNEEKAPDVQWPYSQKDYMFEHLTVEKEKRERELFLLKQKKLERENEDRETKEMEKEDFDIGDQYLVRPQTKETNESGEFFDSLNDF